MGKDRRQRRARAESAVKALSRDLRPLVLAVEPGLGGGVTHHVQDLAALLSVRCNFVSLSPTGNGLLRLAWARDAHALELFFDVPTELPLLHRTLKFIGINRVHIHHTVRIPQEILRLPIDLNVPFDYTAHDYTSFCPQITVTDREFSYCGEPEEAGCKACLELRPPRSGETIVEWRKRFSDFLSMADRVFVPTKAVENRLRRHFPASRIVLAAHPERRTDSMAGVKALPTLLGNEPLKVLVLGALNAVKGADILDSCALDAKKRGLPIEYHLMGYAYRSLSCSPNSNLWIHGRYDQSSRRSLLATISPHIAWFPARWPETYSYTLSEVLEEGMPVAGTNLGAIEERLRGRHSSWTLPWETSPSAWNDFFLRLRDGEHDNEYSSMRIPALPAPMFSYERDYIKTSTKETMTTDLPIARSLNRLTSAYRWTAACFFATLGNSLHEFLRRIYRVKGIRSLVRRLIPEYRVQRLRRWLSRY